MKVIFNFKKARRIGYVVKENCYTVWVETILGANTRLVVKRHKFKHNVREAI